MGTTDDFRTRRKKGGEDGEKIDPQSYPKKSMFIAGMINTIVILSEKNRQQMGVKITRVVM